MPGALQGADDALLLLRIDLDEQVGALGAVPEGSSLSLAISVPVSKVSARRPTASARCAVT